MRGHGKQDSKRRIATAPVMVVSCGAVRLVAAGWGGRGTMIIKWPGFTEILVSDISPSPEREGETEGDLNREETELSSCQPLGEVEQQQTRQMCDSSSTANGVYLVLTIYP